MTSPVFRVEIQDDRPRPHKEVRILRLMNGKPKRTTTAPSHTKPVDVCASVSPESRRILDAFHLGDVATHLLRRAHFVAEELFAQEFAQESITPRQKAALVVLYQNPGISQNALADKLFMDRNTVAEMVKRMAASGLMNRRPSATDQRAYELHLAPQGAALLDRVMPRDIALERMLLERLPAEYRPLFIKCMRLIIEQPTEDEPPAPQEAVPRGMPKRGASTSAT